MSQPLVSVVIPAHNGEAFLGEAIQSVLNQDYPHYELWVIENGSKDKTAQVAQSFPQVNYIHSEIPSVALARNQGITLSRGEYIAFLDQDDTWVPEKLTKQVHFLESDKRYGGVLGLQKTILQAGHQKPHWIKQECIDKLQCGYLPSALMVRRSVFDVLGYFDPAYPLSSDAAWFFKAKHTGIEMGMIDEVMIHRRIHSENNSGYCAELHKDLLSTIHASLKERRKACAIP